MRTNHRVSARRSHSEKRNSERFLRRLEVSSYGLAMAEQRSKRRDETSPLRVRRFVGKIAILSICVGVACPGTSVDSVLAYVQQPPRISIHRAHVMDWNRPFHSRTRVSSSKIAAERTRPGNVTSNDTNVNSNQKTVVVEDSQPNFHAYNTPENLPEGDFFHGDGISGMMSARLSEDMMNLELLLDDINERSANNVNGNSPILPGVNQENGNIFSETQDKRPEDAIETQTELDRALGNDISGNDARNRTSLFRRVRPFRRIKRLFRGPPSMVNEKDANSTITSIGLQSSYSGDDDEESYDDSGMNRRPSLRQLWKKRHARTLEEGIRREQKNKLSFLMNKALITARPSQEKTYVERSLMGLINGLAEEVEDLDIEVNTISKTPLWRKEVEEIRINFSRLGFRPIQIRGTTSIVELVDADEDIATATAVITNATSTDLSTTANEDGKEDNESEKLPDILSVVDCPDEGFDSIDEDGSGTLDREELAQALKSISGIKTDKESIDELATDLVMLYDDNGDGVVDREEYKRMVDDMAKLRDLKMDELKKNQKNPFTAMKDSIQSVSEGISNRAGEVVSAARNKYFSEKNNENMQETEMGSIVLSNVNLDLRRLVFGGIPVVKKITPGGPLILEPFTATVTASFSREDVMGSFLLDAALRRLVARALRVRVRSYRDLTDGALFKGRQWTMTSKAAPVVEVLGLSNVEFDSGDKMIITGKARIRADPDAPIVTSTFKLRTTVGTRKNGQVIKLKEPELAFVFECPKALERGLEAACKTFGLPPPKRPEPYYSFFPIYSPFKVDDDTGGFDMGEDNCIRSIYIKNGKLRFEMSVVLRPGRFLGNHYLAFTVPQRTFIITMDRVWNGVRAARENKQVADRAKKLKKSEKKRSAPRTSPADDDFDELSETSNELTVVSARSNPRRRFFKTIKENTPKPKSFYTRFVEGYTMLEREEEANNERISNDISNWFGRQGRSNEVTPENSDGKEEE